MMKYRLFAISSLLVPALCMGADILLNINLNNPLDIDRNDCPVVIDLNKWAPDIAVSKALVMDGSVEVPSQIDDLDCDDIADELSFVIDMAAGATKDITVTLSDVGDQTDYEPRVWAGFFIRGQKKGQTAAIREVTVPGDVNFYNMVYGHGPMFESELVGYRVYFNEKQTLDPYGKFQKRLELRDCQFYPTDQQLEQGFGDDVLLAGNSCGIGAFKGWDGSKATHIQPIKSRTERLLAAGPIRTVVEVEVDNWDYQNEKLDMTCRYILYAGHRDLEVDVKFRKPLGEQIFATGVERIMGDETVSWSDNEGLVASWGRHWPVNDTIKYAKETIGIATYIPKKYICDETEDPSNFLYLVSNPSGSGFNYHTMFTSKKETFGFDDASAWFDYLPLWRRELDNPLLVTITPIP